jgi:predicted DNA-binding protein (UPF0251 family)
VPRPVRVRRVCEEPKFTKFVPQDGTDKESQVLTIEEYETIRHVDYQNKTHEECAALMDISRTTVTEIYESARFKIADALINGKTLCVEGGNYRVCEGGECCFSKDKKCNGDCNN